MNYIRTVEVFKLKRELIHKTKSGQSENLACLKMLQ